MDKIESDSLQDQAIKNGTEQQNDTNSLSKKSKSRDSNKEIRQFFYNPKTGTVMTRTPLQWLQLILFILFAWAVIIGFTIACWAAFRAIRPDDKVKKDLSLSIRGGRHTFGGLLLPLRWVIYSEIIYIR